MAQLTADDVVLKKFQPTKFREGYDQVEVDDFLDEVALSMRALSEENEKLKAALAAANQRVEELSRSGGGVPVGVDEPTIVAPPLPPEPELLPTLGAKEPSQGPEPQSATSMLALAQKLHDEYVRAGQEEGDQILNDAKAKAAGIVREAEEASARTLSKLEQDRSVLERKIDELRIFERDYRTRLKTYLENLLADIDGKVAAAPGQGGAWDGGRADGARAGSQLGG
ncbi:MAG: DivIVA domain-containing protein [Bifidobacteriaceae bacterium]|jgi:DivIVA domain-containing protein|nr:DivIVA domain-containing protein [Bifidobacteriaceae bacterium]